ncbi:trypsin-2-like [Galleria mellonella]|uniref:Trypsin-2-like n=1 Tax=Galleria mellonella TaxID=7137 RepID=A0A6J3C6G9_GALME|nr:trypsin-2-like [Galleria mellonella]
MNIIKIFIIINMYVNKLTYSLTKLVNKQMVKYKVLSDHTMVSNSDIFPYVVAILKKSTYMSAGALIDDNWVLTAADCLFLIGESLRIIRIRVGSINYKKGGLLLPIKSFNIHPYFDNRKPEFNIALIMLPERVRFSHNVSPIRVQKYYRGVTATHFIITAWSGTLESKESTIESMETIKRRRMLTVSHLHPSSTSSCANQLATFGINETETTMCLDPTPDSNPCARDIGAPVVLNGVLWGVISSWKPDGCDLKPGSSFVTLVGAANVSSWIHATIRGHRWSHYYKDNYTVTNTNNVDYDIDDENNI